MSTLQPKAFLHLGNSSNVLWGCTFSVIFYSLLPRQGQRKASDERQRTRPRRVPSQAGILGGIVLERVIEKHHKARGSFSGYDALIPPLTVIEAKSGDHALPPSKDFPVPAYLHKARARGKVQ